MFKAHHCDGPSGTGRLNEQWSRRRLLVHHCSLFLAVPYALSAAPVRQMRLLGLSY